MGTNTVDGNFLNIAPPPPPQPMCMFSFGDFLYLFFFFFWLLAGGVCRLLLNGIFFGGEVMFGPLLGYGYDWE